MLQYALRRLALFLPTLFLASIAIFLLMRVAPGDVAIAILQDDATPEAIATIRQELGLDRPLYVQYFDWLVGIVTLDLGTSMVYRGEEIGDMIASAFPITLHLTILGLLITVVFAIPIGIYSALGSNQFVKYACRVFAIAGLSLPTFWVAVIVLFVLVIYFNRSPSFSYVSLLDDPWASFKVFVIPASVFAYNNMAVIARMLRSQLLEIAGEDFVRTARAKGLRRRDVEFRHALPNALLPVVTVFGNQFAVMITGLVIVERIFALPGLGTMMVTATLNSDYMLVQTLFMVITALVLFVNLGVDLLYGVLDPRVRLS